MTEPAKLSPTGDLDATRAYYDEFSARYDAKRGGNEPGGYHDMIDDLEVEYTERFGRGLDVLEVGCGTGLILARIARFARTARGIDLSPGMLERARERGLEVTEGSATKLPFEDQSFDVVCSFKVLAHVREIDVAMRELSRVTRRGGTVLAEFYNPNSLRGLVKRLGPAGAISDKAKEDAVFTRFDTERDVRRYLPPELRIVGSRGVRIVTPAAKFMEVPALGALLSRAEWALCDSPARALGGFVIYAMRKD